MKPRQIYNLIKYFVTINGINNILYEDERDSYGNITKKSIQDYPSFVNFFEILINYYSENKIPVMKYSGISVTEIGKINIIKKTVDIGVNNSTYLYNLLDYMFVEFKNILEKLSISSPGDILFFSRNAHIIIFLNNARFFPVELREQIIEKFKIHPKNIKIFNMCNQIVLDDKNVCNINKPERLNSSSDLLLSEANTYIDEHYKVKNGISLNAKEGMQMLMKIILEFTTTSKSPLIAFGEKKNESLMKRITTILKKNSK